jgi:hypothetical protein
MFSGKHTDPSLQSYVFAKGYAAQVAFGYALTSQSYVFAKGYAAQVASGFALTSRSG